MTKITKSYKSSLKLPFERDHFSRKKPCHLLKRPRKHYWRINIVPHLYSVTSEIYLRCLNCDHIVEIDIGILEELLPTDGTLFEA